jgi:hypothetical protein
LTSFVAPTGSLAFYHLGLRDTLNPHADICGHLRFKGAAAAPMKRITAANSERDATYAETGRQIVALGASGENAERILFLSQDRPNFHFVAASHEAVTIGGKAQYDAT